MEENKEELVRSAKAKLKLLLLGTLVVISIFFLMKFNSEGEKGIEEANGVELIASITKGNSNDLYNLGGHQFSISKEWSVSSSQGPDFIVYRVSATDSVTFGIYRGWHPNLPAGIENIIPNQRELFTLHDSLVRESRNRKLDRAKLNGEFSEKIKAHDRYDYKTEKVIPSRFDSLSLTLYTKDGWNIWALEPPFDSIGDFDILIEFGQDVENKIHIFGESIEPRLRLRIIEIAKSMK